MEILGAVAKAKSSEVGFDFGRGESGGRWHVVVGFGVNVADQGTIVRAEFLHLRMYAFSGRRRKRGVPDRRRS